MLARKHEFAVNKLCAIHGENTATTPKHFHLEIVSTAADTQPARSAAGDMQGPVSEKRVVRCL